MLSPPSFIFYLLSHCARRLFGELSSYDGILYLAFVRISAACRHTPIRVFRISSLRLLGFALSPSPPSVYLPTGKRFLRLLSVGLVGPSLL